LKKEQNGRKSLRSLKPTVGCNASKRRRRRRITNDEVFKGRKKKDDLKKIETTHG
jgi:hypothetical protein